MPKPLQFVLLGIGVLALLAVLGELAYSVAATTHGNTPVKVVKVNAGPYPLTVNLYTYPAHASYALPFSIEPQQTINGTITYDVSSTPMPGDVPATPVRAGLTPDANVHNGVQGTAEITVQGLWDLDITVNGPAGRGTASVPIEATAPPPLPQWLGWTIGLIPLYGLTIFLLMQRGRRRKQPEPGIMTSN
ncbi:hypothetical protein [Dictyobacter kobayashii]|uniref:Uncharacterized protein n=1 Tax=Dictyobacter kobayashii TaxID=2014872 RepID=A0A402ARB7_9CHLR|nr:hypothetical protein [Dictyobacter kobayashii]GCE21644.1 hypothetical protein KDK_54440 [Dictyobacter kobayashii]